ncbi:hypothetical protein [Frigoribacterium faeni]|uniref:hypothetical protein n=1 Tax=Frigoribacterium faeni TaxID=145483 RepID=UPI00141B49B9|nr:hypothetical protein [Frigoribacterium faeni]NIJ05410.1 hypothetical protein [Frigoribacterium faeni]
MVDFVSSLPVTGEWAKSGGEWQKASLLLPDGLVGNELWLGSAPPRVSAMIDQVDEVVSRGVRGFYRGLDVAADPGPRGLTRLWTVISRGDDASLERVGGSRWDRDEVSIDDVDLAEVAGLQVETVRWTAEGDARRDLGVSIVGASGEVPLVSAVAFPAEGSGEAVLQPVEGEPFPVRPDGEVVLRRGAASYEGAFVEALASAEGRVLVTNPRMFRVRDGRRGGRLAGSRGICRWVRPEELSSWRWFERRVMAPGERQWLHGSYVTWHGVPFRVDEEVAAGAGMVRLLCDGPWLPRVVDWSPTLGGLGAIEVPESEVVRWGSAVTTATLAGEPVTLVEPHLDWRNGGLVVVQGVGSIPSGPRPDGYGVSERLHDVGGGAWRGAARYGDLKLLTTAFADA